MTMWPLKGTEPDLGAEDGANHAAERHRPSRRPVIHPDLTLLAERHGKEIPLAHGALLHILQTDRGERSFNERKFMFPMRLAARYL